MASYFLEHVKENGKHEDPGPEFVQHIGEFDT